MAVKVNDQEISEKAGKIIEAFQISTGLGTPERVVEELAFTVFELVKVVQSRSKTEQSIPAEKLIGIVSSFLRFEDDLEKLLGFKY
jgi:hypothetical protein